MFGLFKKKPKKLILDFEKKVFRSWKISSKDNSTKIRFRASLGMCCAALLYKTSKGEDTHLLNLIYEQLGDSVSDEKCKVYKIFSNAYEVQGIDFSEGKFLLNADLKNGNVTMKGSDILAVLAEVFGNEAINFIFSRHDGQVGVAYAGILFIKDLTIGKIDGDLKKDMQLVKELHNFIDAMIQNFKK